MPQYIFERLNEIRLKDIQFLYKSCFDLKVSLSFLHHKYNTEVFGGRFIGFIAYDPVGFPAAYYGVFPSRILYKGKSILAAQSGDTMTHPQHQKKGLFVSLALKTYELAAQEGIQFVYGFPNQNSFPGFAKKLNWQFYNCMYDFKKESIVLPLAGFARKFEFTNKIYQTFIESVLSKYLVTDPKIISQFNHGQETCVEKSTSFLEYKLRLGSFPIRYKELLLWIKVDGLLLVGDIINYENTSPNQVIKKLRGLALMLGCRKIVFSASKNAPLFTCLSSELEPIPSLPIGFLPLNNNWEFQEIPFVRLDYDTF